MPQLQADPSLDFPDDPLKWDGWSKYKADNPYERLCFAPKARPNDEQIQAHCAALTQWWQKKLRLKNQPSNPLAQLLGRGLDEATTFLVEARMLLLDPEQRRQIDADLAARVQQEALEEFSRYVAGSISGRILTPEAEANLAEFAHRNGLTDEQTRACIEQELQRNNAKRAPAPRPPAAPTRATVAPLNGSEAEKDFVRILGLSKLNLADATPSVRRTLITIGENLGLALERSERLLEDYLDQEESAPRRTPAAPVRIAVPPRPAVVPPAAPPPPPPPIQVVVPGKIVPSRSPAGFLNPVGAQMVLIPGGEFTMGSEAGDAGPDERPLTPVTLSEFYLSRFPVTNAEYERFDPAHRQKRMNGAGDDYPVVYVTSLEAVRYCQWLGERDGKNYRLPTEAEWEFAARGIDGRKYPWGSHDRRGGFANFADASTAFPWRDTQVNDGYPETSPVGAFPRGASFFGLEDMAGNVWEWCLDFYQPLAGVPKRNPRGVSSGPKRVYRGGSWKSRFSNLRATARGSNAANFSCNDIGFRVACEIGTTAPEE